MAADGIDLLAALGVERAHVVGASMGGMIAQRMAIEHPSRVRTLTSMMSSTGEPGVGQSTPQARQALFAPRPADRAGYVRAAERDLVWASRRYADVEALRELAAAGYDRAYYPAGAARQVGAVALDGSRAGELANLQVPTRPRSAACPGEGTDRSLGPVPTAGRRARMGGAGRADDGRRRPVASSGPVAGSAVPAPLERDMDESTVRAIYDRISAIPWFWEVDAWTCRATASSPYRARVIGQLGLGPTSRVLDVACGTGLNFHFLQRVTGGAGSVVGVDTSARTLDLARRRVRRRGWRNVDLVEADAADYRPEAPFDAALCTFAIDIIPRWRETISMMVGAVRPGGRLGFIGFRDSDRVPFTALNPLWRASAVVFGGQPDRPVREQVSVDCDEVLHDDVFGGFYYLLVAATGKSSHHR